MSDTALLLLKIYDGDLLLRTQELLEGQHRLGNDGSLEVPLLFPTVSRLHGEFNVSHDTCLYTDLTSRNGTTIFSTQNNKFTFAPQATAVPLCHGEELRIGPFRIEVYKQRETKRPLLERREELRQSLHTYAAPFVLRAETTLQLLTLELSNWSQPRAALYELNAREAAQTAKEVAQELLGHGPFSDYIADMNCTEFMANSPSDLFIDRGRGIEKLNARFHSERSYLAWIRRLVVQAGTRLDLQSPTAEGRLVDGSRLQAVIAPVSTGCAAVSIRRFSAACPSIEEALANSWMTAQQLVELQGAVAQKKNILVCGGTGAGKTTLLNFLARMIPSEQRVVTVEDVFELQLGRQNVVGLQARRSNADAVGDITIRDLVRTALRLRPDRIIVGECRGAEVMDMLQAMNTGHPGSLSTIHANSTSEAIERLELLALLADNNLSSDSVRRWIGIAINIVVHVERNDHGVRRISHVLSL